MAVNHRMSALSTFERATYIGVYFLMNWMYFLDFFHAFPNKQISVMTRLWCTVPSSRWLGCFKDLGYNYDQRVNQVNSESLNRRLAEKTWCELYSDNGQLSTGYMIHGCLWWVRTWFDGGNQKYYFDEVWKLEDFCVANLSLNYIKLLIS